MKKTTIKLICLILVLVIICSVLISCSKLIYNEKWIIGKTVDEITEIYGEYHHWNGTFAKDENGDYILDENGNRVVERIYYIAYLTNPSDLVYKYPVDYKDEFVEIYFDDDGIAYKVLYDRLPKGG